MREALLTRAVAVAALLVAALLVAADVAAPHALPATVRYTSWTETLVDTSRATAAGAATQASLARTLVTTIYRPRGRGPFPLVVFAHGLNGHPDEFRQLLGSWAAAGYVVAAPAFPLTNNHVPSATLNWSDVAQQPGDVSFVLTKLLRENRDRASRLNHAIEPKRIGAGGLSLGGATTYGVTYAKCCRDSRIKAAEVLDGLLLGVGAHQTMPRPDGHVPLLIAHSDTDASVPYAGVRAIFEQAPPPVWLVTLHGAAHASQWDDTPTPYDAIAERITVDFWNATLKHDRKAFTRLQQDATVAGLSSIDARP